MIEFARRIVAKLRPDRAEIESLANREVDPALANRFRAITLGPVGNAFCIFAILVLAVIEAPYRLARSRRD